jgi:group I intron endonuclease
MESGIYVIRCNPTGVEYYGGSVNIRHRWFTHRSHLRGNCHNNRYLQRAWNKYGEVAFDFEIISTCWPEQVLELEQATLDFVFERMGQERLFNVCRNATSFRKGLKCSEEQKAKISATMKGRPGRKHSVEVIERIRRAKCKPCSGFIKPDGTTQETIEDLKDFCFQNNLDYTVMNKVFNGKRKSHKGWTRPF